MSDIAAENIVTLEAAPAQQAEPAKPTRTELEEKGWTRTELDSAEKKGMVAKPTEVKPEAKPAEPVVEPTPAPAAAPKTGNLPDFDLSPEKEKAFLAAFGEGTSPRALYWRMKNERRARQSAEAKAKDMEQRIQALEAKPADDVDPLADEDQPLTLKQLKALQVAEAARIEQARGQQQERAATVTAAQAEQEAYAKSLFPDFDATVGRAKDLMENLEALLPEKWMQTKAVKLIRDLQVAASQADQIGLDEYNAAIIAYELGRMHPEHGKAPVAAPKTGTPRDPKGNGTLTPEQMKKVAENTQRRASSAALPGAAGTRVVSADDITVADLNGMSAEARLKFRQSHPERWARLVRG